MSQAAVVLPDSVKMKRYRQEFRTRFCEGLLSRRILVAEGVSEATALPAVARRLSELNPEIYSSLEALGICTIDAGSDTQIADLASIYRALGKTVCAVCDTQDEEDEIAIRSAVDALFMHGEKGLEDLILKDTTTAALERFADQLTWPPHLQTTFPNPKEALVVAVAAYFQWSKGNWGIAEFLAQCEEAEIPEWLRETCAALHDLARPSPEAPPEEPADETPETIFEDAGPEEDAPSE